MCFITSGFCRRAIALDRSFRRQIWLTVATWAACGVSLVAFADDAQNPLNVSAWFTPQNIITIGVLLYHFGMLREQFNNLRERVVKLEKDRDEETRRRLNSIEDQR